MRFNFILSIIFVVGFMTLSSYAGEGKGNPNESCPQGTDLIAKFEWRCGSYVFEKPAGNENIITLANVTEDGGDWTSSVPICHIILKGGTKIWEIDFGVNPVYSGAFSNTSLPDNPSGHPPAISNIQFCAGPCGCPSPPECELVSTNPGPPMSILVRIQSPLGGLAQVKVMTLSNATVEIPKGSGNYYNKGDIVSLGGIADAVYIEAVKIDQNSSANLTIKTTDECGQSTVCDPVYTTLSGAAPNRFALLQNYPNPFNPTTTIHFNVSPEINEITNVTLKIFDITGREVKTLINGPIEPGQYSVAWDGTNYRGEIVAGGIYMYRMVAGHFVETKRMILMK